MNDAVWVEGDDRPLQTIARNIATRYALVGVEMIVGLLTLPFNLHHLGPEAYGLLTLTAGITVHFSILDLGYGGAMVKFVAQYRAHRDARALNEVASTIFVVFSAFGVIAYLVIIALALNIGHVFTLTPSQIQTGRWILLIVGLNVAVNFAFAVYGGVCVGFQRVDRNNIVAVCWSAWSLPPPRCGCSPTSSTGTTPTTCSRCCVSPRRCSAAIGCAR
jgi:O-antigen/teichoic acid export membrane protein